jgi:Flp pilus assembly protein TadD
MIRISRGFFVLGLSVSMIGLAACGTTSSSPTANVSNKAEASRVNSILERAAQQAKASGNKAEAAVLLEQIHNNNPKDAAIATAYAQALREDDQLNKARQVLLPHTDGDDAFPDAVTELAMVQLALGQYKEAELTSRKAVELDPNSGRAYLSLGTALDAQNYHEQAEVAFRRGVDKWKGDPAPVLNNLALNLASQNKLDQALDMLKKAQEISPGRAEIERNMRIISTLKEGADDFIVRGGKTTAPIPKSAPKKVEEPTVKKEEPKKADAKKETVKTEAKPEPKDEAKPKEKAETETKKAEKKTPPAPAERKHFGANN